MSLSRKPFGVKDINNKNNIVSPRNVNTKVQQDFGQKAPKITRNKENMEPFKFKKITRAENSTNTKLKQPSVPVLVDNSENKSSQPSGAKKRERNSIKFTNSMKFTNTIPVADYRDDLRLFEVVDAPILRLSNDCLLTIFELCKDLHTLITLSRVSRSWRVLSLQPILWRNMEYTWSKFNRQLTRLHKPLGSLQQIQYLRTLTISAQDHISTQLDLNIPKTSPFQELVTLNLIDVSLDNIGYIMLWMTHITALNCQNIHVEETSQVHLPSFSKLHRLKSLRLRFAKPSSLAASYFTYKFKQILADRILPDSLEILELVDIYDREEYLLSRQDIKAAAYFLSNSASEGTEWDRELEPQQILDIWVQLENRLVFKYSMLSYLSNLTCLSLSRTTSFTARVWRECLIPCGSKLTSLSLTGWSGKRESPQSMINRNNASQRRIQQSGQPVPDVELALSEFITSLTEVQTIALDDFFCTYGVISGIKELVKDGKKEYCIENNDMHHDIAQYYDEPLYNFKILIKIKSGKSR